MNKLFIIIGIVMLGIIGYCVLPAQTGAAWKKFVEKVNTTIGAEDVRIAGFEQKYRDLEKEWEKQVYIKHQFAVMGESAENDVIRSSRQAREISRKYAVITNAVANNQAFVTSSGRVYTTNELTALAAYTGKLAADKQETVSRQEQRISNYSRYQQRAAELQQRARDTLDLIRDHITELKAKKSELSTLKLQVELAKEITADVKLNFDSLTADMRRTSTDIEAQIRTNEELLDRYMQSTPNEQLATQLADF